MKVDSGIIVAILGFLGSFIATFAGIITSSKLSNYRIEQLEKKVEKHNSVVERTALLENDMQTVKSDIVEIKNDVHSIKNL